jgi:hypothetical protein
VLQDFARYLHWSAADVLDGMSWAEFVTVWCGAGGGERRGQHDPDRLRAQINRRRAAKGLPPMKPNPRKG